MEKIVILGGGVAGLSALNALLDQGHSPLLLEAGQVGSPKMCGEFIAPRAVSILERFGMTAFERIKAAHFYAGSKTLIIPFKNEAAAFSRTAAEKALALRATQCGGRIQEKARLVTLKPATFKTPYYLTLASGQEIEAESVFFATGKLDPLAQAQPALPYFGIKMQIPRIFKANTLEMYSSPGAYFGFVPLTETSSNFACLARRTVVETAGSAEAFLRQVAQTNHHLKELLQTAELQTLIQLQGPAPDFQYKHPKAWPRAYWLGDALASLYPALGSGFSHSLYSASLAAKAYQQRNPTTYLRAIKKDLGPKRFLGKCMHQLLLHPHASSALFPLLAAVPRLSQMALRLVGF